MEHQIDPCLPPLCAQVPLQSALIRASSNDLIVVIIHGAKVLCSNLVWGLLALVACFTLPLLMKWMQAAHHSIQIDPASS